MNERRSYPMSALVGLDDLVLALVLCAIDPAIGGVLLRGDKGSGKTTAARALSSLLPEGAPFVEIPLGATEDRVVGSVDVAAILGEGEHRFAPGLLQAADGGVLYVDEVNLLPDHLVDVLLDAAATGVNRVERDGVSFVHPSRFVLVGSMNPEEGELRPQLLDRFGLSVRVSTPSDPGARAEAVRRRLSFDADPEPFVTEWGAAEDALADRVRATRAVPLEPGLERAVAALCVGAGAEGLRADLVICRAAAALGGWRAKAAAGQDEVATVAPLALGHRRRSPFAQAAPDPRQLGELLEQAMRDHDTDGAVAPSSPASSPPSPPPPEGSGPPEGSAGDGSARADRQEKGGPAQDSAPRAPRDPAESVDPVAIDGLLELRRRGGAAPSGRRRSRGSGPEGRGRTVSTEPLVPGRGGGFSVAASILATVERTSGARPLAIEPADFRTARRERRGDNVIVLAVDTSGSMGVTERVAAARGAVLALVADAYQRRDRVAVVAYRDRSAAVVLRPTSSTEVALARLAEVATGGRTPLAAGIEVARDLAVGERRKGAEPLIVLVTDGRATWADDERDPLEAALEAGRSCRAERLDALVVDCEATAHPLEAARALAEEMGARYVSMGALADHEGAERLTEAISRSLG